MKSQNFKERYRPKCFSEIVGNIRTVKMLINMVKSGPIPTGVIFHGPPGSGKTALALLLVKALHCQNFLVDVCGKCEACLSFERKTPGSTSYEFRDYIKISKKVSPGSKPPAIVDYDYIDCSRMSARVLEDILRSLEFPSDSSTGLRIIILDEFQRALNDRIQDQFLIALEKYTNILLIFCLIDLKKVHEAFQQRPTVLKTKRPEIEELIPWLQKICTAEKIVVKDNSALEQVARSAHRLPRECLAFLEKAVWLGEPLSTALVKEIAQDHEDSKYSLDD